FCEPAPASARWFGALELLKIVVAPPLARLPIHWKPTLDRPLQQVHVRVAHGSARDPLIPRTSVAHCPLQQLQLSARSKPRTRLSTPRTAVRVQRLQNLN